MTRFLVAFVVLLFTPLAAAREIEPIVTTEIEGSKAIPGQVIRLRVTVLVPTWLPRPPVFPSFEVPNVMVRLPERSSGPTSKRVGGETWSGVTRVYQMTPMVTGRFAIPEQVLTITYADPDTRVPVTVSGRTEPIVLEAVPPPGAEDLDPFIAASSLVLEQSIEGDPSELTPGESFERIVSARIEGVSPVFIPPLTRPIDTASLATYATEPVLVEVHERGRLSGSRTERVTFVAEAGGRLDAPQISVRWYNLKSETIEETTVPGFPITIRGPLPAAQSFDWRPLLPSILGTLLVAASTILATVRLWPRFMSWKEKRLNAYRASETWAYREAAGAIRGRQLGDALNAIHLWLTRLPAKPDTASL
ncbi:MAG: hypothetical protein AAGF59_10205, partial [Pseudomonadota bacterium]